MPKFCSKCGTALGEEYKFCPKCGHTLGAPLEAAVPQATTPTKTIKKKSPAAAAVLNFFLPGMGYLYLGKWWGIPIFIALILYSFWLISTAVLFPPIAYIFGSVVGLALAWHAYKLAGETIPIGSAPAESSRIPKAVLVVLLAFALLGFLGYFLGGDDGDEDGWPPITTSSPPTDEVTIRGTVGVPAAGAKSGVAGTAFTQATSPYTVMLVAEGGQPLSRRTRPRCDPGPCRGVPNAPVSIMRPGASGWQVSKDSWTTDSTGNFVITVDENLLTYDGPIFVGASDPSGTVTLMSTIPADLILAGATIELAVDRTTTTAAVMHCPGGVFPPRGGYCYSDPEESKSIETLYAKIDLYFADNPSTTLDLDIFLPDLLNDPDILNALNQILVNNDLAQVSAQEIIEETDELPIVTSRPIVTTSPPTPTRRPPWTAEPPQPPTSSPPRLPSGFPTNMPTGTYSITMRVCAPY
ncbi:MAG: zinc ribbon domain-containing protein, partial [Candidatus Hydrothermarchaeota archaeon]